MTEEQIAAWTAGERPQELRLHVEACSECRAQLTEFDEVLSAFRDRVHQVSEAHGFRARETAPARASWWRPLTFAPALLALVLCGFLGLKSWNFQAPAGAPAIDDATVLKQVDAALSESVPSPLKPITELVSWESAAEGNAAARQTRRDN